MLAIGWPMLGQCCNEPTRIAGPCPDHETDYLHLHSDLTQLLSP
jgi:hypothetical protein